MKFVFNDGGRSQAGYSGFAADCVARSIAIAMEISYDDAYAAMAEVNYKKTGKRSARNGTYTRTKAFDDFMESHGWKWKATMGIGTGCKVHLNEKELPDGRLIVSVSKHMTAVINKVLHDTHDCTRGGRRCVYGYYYKP